jgi:hypothetical protein
MMGYVKGSIIECEEKEVFRLGLGFHFALDG